LGAHDCYISMSFLLNCVFVSTVATGSLNQGPSISILALWVQATRGDPMGVGNPGGGGVQATQWNRRLTYSEGYL
jgi:hypothetical protein